jgi:hypothetical protein
VVSRELLSGRAITPAPAPARPAQGDAAQDDAVNASTEAAPAARPRFSRLGEPNLSDEGAAPAGPLLADDEALARPAAGGPDARDVRRARVAGLIAHAGRLTHVQLMLDDAGVWHEQVMAAAVRRRPGKGSRLLLLDAGTRAGVVRMLGAELAEDDSAVLLDLASLDQASGPGLSELLSGDAGFGEIISRDPESRLHVIGAGRAGREAVLGAPDLLDVALDALADAYAIVLIATPTRDVHRDREALTARIDGALVLADQVSNGHAVETAYRIAEGHDLPVAIAVFHEGAAEAHPAAEPAPFPLRVEPDKATV